MRASGMNFLGKEQVQTPNLDKLAGESTVFTNAHIMGGTSGAVSMPSRAMLMTGKYLYNLEKQGATIPDSHTMIGETLQEAGYNTFHTGKWHSSYEALNRCFKDGKAIFFGGMWDHWNVPLYDYHSDMNYGKRRPVIRNQAKSNKVEYEKGEYMYSGKHSVDIFTHEAIEYIQQQKDKNQSVLPIGCPICLLMTLGACRMNTCNVTIRAKYNFHPTLWKSTHSITEN